MVAHFHQLASFKKFMITEKSVGVFFQFAYAMVARPHPELTQISAINGKRVHKLRLLQKFESSFTFYEFTMVSYYNAAPKAACLSAF